MLDKEALARLRKGRNLLAFSGGADSTALFHLLKEAGISFDLATVNYHTRPKSDEEAAFAQHLAEIFGKRAHILDAPMDPEASGFEAKARRVRYDFFGRLAKEFGYDHLVTAHQLDDLLEWGLMQLCRGCGVAEFVGMAPVEKRQGYTLVRPLLFTPKKALLRYLRKHNLTYYEDASNLSPRHTRNRFRHEAAAFLMEESAEGIARSFRYMLADKKALLPASKPLFRHGALRLLAHPGDDTAALRLVDRVLKEEGYLLSAPQKRELIDKKSVVVGGEWAVVIEEARIWIAPYRTVSMPKTFKEACRRAKVPPKIRPYLFETEGLEPLLSALSSAS
ncbi:tRNA lysidine(34) synthetase TilS [Hydrogenimonas sp.]